MLERFQRIDCSGNNGCSKIRMIQDYIPRKFSFSLGNSCDDQQSLKGTKYKVDVYFQRNETSCFAMPDTLLNCSRFHSLVPYQNLLGDSKDKDPVQLKSFLDNLQRLKFPSNCYPHLEEFLCNIFLPQCDPKSESTVVPCREMYDELEMGCADTPTVRIFRATPNNIGVIDNECLPRLYGSIPCWYKPVMCETPPNTTKTAIAGGLNESGVYYGGSKLQYSCIDESLDISGNSTVTCLFSGLWSHTPVCVNPDGSLLLLILLPVLNGKKEHKKEQKESSSVTDKKKRV